MFKIVEKRELAENVDEFVIEAPEIAAKAQPGQFVIVRVTAKGERIPLTIAEKDPEAGTITLMVQRVGKSTFHLSCFEEGNCIKDVVGPLGKPTHIEKWGHVVAVGGGLGLAPIHHICQGVKEAGNQLTVIMGFRKKELIFWEDKMKLLADRVIVTTNDGSYGMKGLVTDALQKLIDDGEKIDMVICAGPVPMMKAVADLTKKYGIPTVASLNPIMVDGTGMCGACRVTVGGETKFACVDGPEFDAHQVDFDELMNRLKMFKDLEKVAMERFQEKHCGCKRGQ
ncbi:sulfide dehydrogenase (flavoprotein) subunit SudB [Desulfurobacterium pacificum]|jgi:ferredoxin--NADP+ reductase|uniref:Sulfide dehydrogenase (Flavoprotein) subunit SudB n=1 Tax=Desulfurobacterium pacificum TaxID=240166 RepID=A0ABY1NF35_9BACT|nr:sulfide/dihydroorotate dehydrogenase-like FAD/NAD-binding protein [Desulfurobacterium pacificum]SMP08001.1 sulfide dehydrogenase (flavoprotein) subunit SudB [Desulfurobacterium pacificum]